MTKTAKDVLKLCKEQDVKYIDFRFTDPRGKMQHVTFDITFVDEETLDEGLMFDGSSIAGWKAINESDMLLKPDCSSCAIDPFFAQTTLAIFCDVLEPATGQPYGIWRSQLKHFHRTGAVWPSSPFAATEFLPAA